ncbi:FMN-binding protein [Eremococcus coleocola]|uniref:FMN-binding protein n=1 Tax=Eremococcus coleocola TaxID=88132 RepID=UPI0009D6C8F2
MLFIINFRESETEIFTSDASKKVIQSIIEKHSPDVDVISGATMTPKAIIDAVKKAMDSK